MADNRLQWRHLLAIAAVALCPVCAQAGVQVFNASDLSPAALDIAGPLPDAVVPPGDEAARVWLTGAQPDGTAFSVGDMARAAELTTPAIILTAFSLISLAMRGKKRIGRGRPSLWGALGNASPMDGM